MVKNRSVRAMASIRAPRPFLRIGFLIWLYIIMDAPINPIPDAMSDITS
jgi:hypothetical protein